jgi:hypothetical protein
VTPLKNSARATVPNILRSPRRTDVVASVRRGGRGSRPRALPLFRAPPLYISTIQADTVSEQSERSDLMRTRVMGACFALGSICFVIGPLDAYATRVGADADAINFFIGSILFTMGGLTQCWLAMPERGLAGAGIGAWRAAWTQSIGTLFFNFMTFAAIGIAVTSVHYNALVWLPNAVGSACFLTSGALLYLSSLRRGWLPARRHDGWWEPSVNGLGCVLFGVSAVAGYVITSTGEMVSLSAANWGTTLGAACFLAVALAAVATGRSFKVPRLRQLRALELAIEHDVQHTGQVFARDFVAVEGVVEREVKQVVRDAEQVVREVESGPRVLGGETFAE